MYPANRFKEARTRYNQHGPQSVKDVSKATGITASLIDDLESPICNRAVGYQKIKALAEHYGVSSDYLLGLSDAPTQDKQEGSAADYTGLSVEAIRAIRDNKGVYSVFEIFDSLIANGDFIKIARILARYRSDYDQMLKIRHDGLVEREKRARRGELTLNIETGAPDYEDKVKGCKVELLEEVFKLTQKIDEENKGTVEGIEQYQKQIEDMEKALWSASRAKQKSRTPKEGGGDTRQGIIRKYFFCTVRCSL